MHQQSRGTDSPIINATLSLSFEPTQFKLLRKELERHCTVRLFHIQELTLLIKLSRNKTLVLASECLIGVRSYD